MMSVRFLTFSCFLLCSLLMANSVLWARQEAHEGELELVMRSIGHEILLASGDSTTRVLPIERNLNRYRISFDKEIAFEPERLVFLVDSILKATETAKYYLGEVQECEGGAVTYSFRMGRSRSEDLLPCRGREYPKGCYHILLTLLELQQPGASPPMQSRGGSPTGFPGYLWTLLLLLPPVLYLAWRFSKKLPKTAESPVNPDQVSIGAFRFDRNNMQLDLAGKATELSHKEAELLHLLHSSVNTTLERDHLLKMVWDDEGNYVGRTLDVYISKLRKKLAPDPNLKIINIRGVGYKLVVNPA